MPAADVRLLVTCEHGGNRIPPRYRKLFAPHQDLLNSHRGWDPGALAAARRLSKALGAPLIEHTVSRLLIDLNRSEHHRALFSQMTRALPVGERARILDDVYRPYRARVIAEIERAIHRGQRVVHVSLHSFVPVLDGERRRADLALLYDPSRRSERDFCQKWLAAMKRQLPELALRRNSPYRGNADGLTTALRRKCPANRYMGIEVEMNQRLMESGQFDPVVRVLIESLRSVLRA
jgi:predicted N-formylglutamate amidohydrolase